MRRERVFEIADKVSGIVIRATRAFESEFILFLVAVSECLIIVELVLILAVINV